MNQELTLMREQGFKYFVGAFGPLDEDGNAVLYHVCGYPEQPTQDDINSLIEELAQDTEFNMTEMKYNEDYVLIPVDESTFEE